MNEENKHFINVTEWIVENMPNKNQLDLDRIH